MTPHFKETIQFLQCVLTKGLFIIISTLWIDVLDHNSQQNEYGFTHETLTAPKGAVKDQWIKEHLM